MLKRKAFQDLLDWKKYNRKKALLVTGARQVGKTFLVREFAKQHYEVFAEVNLLENAQAKKVLSEAVDSEDLLLRLSSFLGVEFVPHKTLIFIDEVQESKEIVTAIKFLVEKYDYDFVLSGSLLGVELKDIKSWPVGYLRTIEMFPLDFQEFCWSQGVSSQIEDLLKESLQSQASIPDYIHESMLRLFHKYLIVGGMPEVINGFIETNNIETVRRIQKDIIVQHREDIAKYKSSEALNIKRIYDLIPGELNKQNKRFHFKSLVRNARFDRYENNFLWLIEAGVVLPTYAVSDLTYPLLASQSPSMFKLFLMDVGLLTNRLLGTSSAELLSKNSAVNYGSIYENVVAQELRTKNLDLYYYNSKKYGELDFVVQATDNTIIPVEVKSGKGYRRHKALTNVLEVENYDFSYGYVLCEDNVHVEGRVVYLPVYSSSYLEL